LGTHVGVQKCCGRARRPMFAIGASGKHLLDVRFSGPQTDKDRSEISDRSNPSLDTCNPLCCDRQWPGGFMGNRKSNKKRLRVCRVVDVPLHEVSGICLRRGRNGRMFLIAVGDRMAKIEWFAEPRSDGGRIDWHTRNIAKLSGSMLPK